MATACTSIEPFALRVLDEAMAPDLPAGTVVVVDPGEPAQDGCLVLLECEGELLLRRLRLVAAAREEDSARLVAPAAPDIVLGRDWRRSVRGVVTASRVPR